MGQANQTTLHLVLGAATRWVLQLAQHLEDLDQQLAVLEATVYPEEIHCLLALIYTNDPTAICLP